jgi:hypothetical protein
MSMSDRPFIALPCKLTPGGFSGERVFEVELADGKLYRGVAPRQFCWNDQGRLVAENEPADEASGMVDARALDWTDDGQTIVEVPDGEVIAVAETHVKRRPTDIKPPEPRFHVPVGP